MTERCRRCHTILNPDEKACWKGCDVGTEPVVDEKTPSYWRTATSLPKPADVPTPGAVSLAVKWRCACPGVFENVHESGCTNGAKPADPLTVSDSIRLTLEQAKAHRAFMKYLEEGGSAYSYKADPALCQCPGVHKNGHLTSCFLRLQSHAVRLRKAWDSYWRRAEKSETERRTCHGYPLLTPELLAAQRAENDRVSQEIDTRAHGAGHIFPVGCDKCDEKEDLLEAAWGVIANVGWSGEPKSPGWQEAAERFRDNYFARKR